MPATLSRAAALVPLGLELGVLRLEGVGDVLEEDQAEDDVLVLGSVTLPRRASAIRHSSAS
jgi:hypothetical protein